MACMQAHASWTEGGPASRGLLLDIYDSLELLNVQIQTLSAVARRDR